MRVRAPALPVTRPRRGRLAVPSVLEVKAAACSLGLSSAPYSSPELSEWYVGRVVKLNGLKE